MIDNTSTEAFRRLTPAGPITRADRGRRARSA
jgi:hypothetical protein